MNAPASLAAKKERPMVQPISKSQQKRFAAQGQPVVPVPKLKAYKLSCADDDHGQRIVFAESSKSCRGRRGGGSCDCEYIDLRVHRAKEFDQYAPGPVTVEQYLAQGWWWECCGCYRHVHEDDNPIIIGDHVYHGRKCVVMARKTWDDVDLSRCHESVVKLIRELDSWLASNPETETAGSDASVDDDEQ